MCSGLCSVVQWFVFTLSIWIALTTKWHESVVLLNPFLTIYNL